VPEGVLIERLCAEFGLDPDPDVMADRDENKLWRGWNLPPSRTMRSNCRPERSGDRGQDGQAAIQSPATGGDWIPISGPGLSNALAGRGNGVPVPKNRAA